MAEAQHFETVELDWVTPEIARMTLNRPDAGNSLSSTLVRDIIAAASVVRYDKETKVLLVTGGGRFFCAGADLKENPRPASWIWELRRSLDFLEDLPQPVVAVINGSCMGGGTELALACDFRIIGSAVSMGLPEIQFGALPAAGGPQRLLRLIGPAKAKRLIMTGEHITAATALELGLVDEVAEGDLMAAGIAFAEKLALRAGYGLKVTKLVINQGQDMGLREALAMEYRIIDNMASPEERAAEQQKAAARRSTYAKIFKVPGSSSPV